MEGLAFSLAQLASGAAVRLANGPAKAIGSREFNDATIAAILAEDTKATGIVHLIT